MRRLAVILGLLGFLAGCDGGGGSAVEPDTTGGPETTIGIDTPADPDSADVVVPDGPPVVPGADYLIVTAGDLLATAEAFRAYREETGYTVSLATVEQIIAGGVAATDEDVAIHIKTWVAMHWQARPQDRPMFLLLVGDADPAFNDPQKTIPAVRWLGLWEGCLSDNHYGEMDGDHVPDVAVGRLPVRSDAQGLDLLDRIVAHETIDAPGPWNHRLNVYAGEGGFGEEVDFFIETVAQKGLEAVPMAFDIRFAYNSPTSTWYYTPFQDIVHEMVTAGAVLTTFMGHGGGELNVPDLTAVKPADRYPMYAFFACSTGEFASDWMTESEEVMLQAGGPMAILVSTTTTHPYANAVNALEIEAAVFEDQPPTYGEAIVGMKWRSLYHESDLRTLIDGFAETQIPQGEMEDTILDHMYSYNLLGDPAVRLRIPPSTVIVDAADATVGGVVEVSGTAGGLATGTARVRIVCGRASVLHQLTPVEDPSDPDAVSVIQENWEKVMDHSVAEADLPVGPGGAFGGILEVPDTTPKGTYWVVVYAEDGAADAVGSTEISIK
ncbi:MAG: C25 family cysteine peptidase [Pseudomonadota bacterium]